VIPIFYGPTGFRNRSNCVATSLKMTSHRTKFETVIGLCEVLSSGDNKRDMDPTWQGRFQLRKRQPQ